MGEEVASCSAETDAVAVTAHPNSNATNRREEECIADVKMGKTMDGRKRGEFGDSEKRQIGLTSTRSKTACRETVGGCVDWSDGRSE